MAVGSVALLPSITSIMPNDGIAWRPRPCRWTSSCDCIGHLLAWSRDILLGTSLPGGLCRRRVTGFHSARRHRWRSGIIIAGVPPHEGDRARHHRLLQADVTDDHKRAIINLIDLSTLTELPKRAALIGPILDRTNVLVSGIDAAKARSLILNSRPVGTQISLFNKFHSTMTVDEAREMLAALPDPFSEITTGYHTPRLPRSDENRALVQWLETRGIISSWSEGGGWFLGDEIRVNLKRR